MKSLLLFFCSVFGCFAQGFSLTGNAFAHLTVRPPNCWVDVRQFIDAAAADGSTTTNYNDYSGHRLQFYDNSAGNTNYKYFTRFGGVLSGQGPGTTGMDVADPTLTNAMLHVLGYSNRCTIAIRIQYRTGNNGWVQTGQCGPPGTCNNIFIQMNGTTIFFDFGANGRISKAKPADFDNNLVNVFFTHGGTNSSIWMNGTNWHSGLVTDQITNNAATPGSYTQPPTGTLRCQGSNISTNYYVKRILWWDYELPQGDIEHWNRYMAYLP